MTGDDGVARTGAGGLPTLEAVASAAGVSRATVSRVINGDQRVAADRRAAVEAAVLRLGYTPNRAARSLVTRRSESLAFVVEEDDDTVFSDPFFGRMARSISEALAEREMQLVLMTARDEGSRARVRRYVLGGHVDGTLLVSTHRRSTFAAGLRAAGVPVVVAGRPSGGVELTYVDADNLGGARAAVTLLAERGCRRIATITGPIDMSPGEDRLRGYEQALTAAGLEVDPALVVHRDFTEAGGAAAMRVLLDRRPRLDGLFAASDLMAAGALRTLAERGLAVPDDVAVVGFDDAAPARHTVPPLTTVHQPIEDIGREMTALALEQVEGETAVRTLVLPTWIVRRESA